MSLWTLALAYVMHRRLVTGFTVVSIAIGLALVLVVLNVRREIERTFLAQAQHYDFVVGPHGSETALVLTGLFHADQPRGNLPLRTFRELEKQSGVTAAFAFNLGDRVGAARIVGTTKSFLEQADTANQPFFTLADGRLFESDFEIVAGSAAARQCGLVVGSKVIGEHGLAQRATESAHESFHDESDAAHEAFPYTVVGILAPTGTAHDRAMFTTLASYWKIHEQDVQSQEPEVTVVLLRVARPLLLQLQQLLPRKFGVMVVRPAEVLQRMFEQVLVPIERVLLSYGFAVVLASATSVLTTLYLATLVRRRELAVLRAIGATPREVFSIVMLEGAILLLLGGAAGVVLGQLASMATRGDVESRFGIDLRAFQFTPAEVAAFAVAFALGLAAALVPAWQAYSSDVASGLGHG